MAKIIIAETDNLANFESAEKVLAFAGLEPHLCINQVKTDIYTHAKFVCRWDAGFNQYLNKKCAEDKAYNVAVFHATKKLTRVIFHLV